jgi:hypothetical protein
MRKNLGFVPNSILIMQRKPKLAKARVAESGISPYYGNLHPRLERLSCVERRARQRRCIDKTIFAEPRNVSGRGLGALRCLKLLRLFFRLDFSGTTSPYVLLKLSFRRPPPLL